MKTKSRQAIRREDFDLAMYAVNAKNLRCVGSSHYQGMPRKERRALARAYAKRYAVDRRAMEVAA